MKELRTCQRKFWETSTSRWEVWIDGKHSHYELGDGTVCNKPSYTATSPLANPTDLPQGAIYKLWSEEDEMSLSSQVKQLEDDLAYYKSALQDKINDLDTMQNEYDFSEAERGKFVAPQAKERWRVTFDWDGNAGDKSEHWGFKNEKKARNFINKLMDKYSAYEFTNVEIVPYIISE